MNDPLQGFAPPPEDEPPRIIGREVGVLLRIQDRAKWACKVFRGAGNEPVRTAQRATLHEAIQVPLNSLRDFHALIVKYSIDQKTHYIYGGLINPKQTKNLRRKHRGKEATLIERESAILVMDIDGERIADLDYNDPLPSIKAWLARKPALKGVAVSVSLSGSWGIKEGLRMRLAIGLDKLLSLRGHRELALAIHPNCDASIYSPSQPIYTAPPLFIEGAVPVYWGERYFYIDGEPLHIDSGSATKELDHWVEEIKGLGSSDSARHPIINAAAYHLGKYAALGVWPAAELVDILAEACEDSGAFEPERLDAARDEIRRAVDDGVKEAPTSGQAVWMEGLQVSDDGKIRANAVNAVHALRAHPSLKGRLRWNSRSGLPEWSEPPPWADERLSKEYPRALIDSDITATTAFLNAQGLQFPKTLVTDALELVAQDVKYDRVVEWLEALPPWDEKARLARIMHIGLGALDTPWSESVGRLLALSMVARAMQPGIKCDTMPILISAKKGIGKSTFCRDLASGPGEGFFSDCPGDYSDPKNFGELAGRFWLIEDGELSRLRTRDKEAVKRTLSAQSDVYRPAYGRFMVDMPKRYAMVGTTNDETPLDEAERRFPTIGVAWYNREWFLENRDQIFAEALALFRSGENPFLSKFEDAIRAEEEVGRIAEAPWESLILDWLNTPNPDGSARESVLARDIATQVLGIPTEKLTQNIARKIGLHLRNLGWILKVVKINGKTFKRFVQLP